MKDNTFNFMFKDIGATTFSVMTLRIMACSIMILGIKGLFVTLSITILPLC